MKPHMAPKPKCPNTFQLKFACRLVAYLGGDPTPIEDNWCWAEIGRQYPGLVPAAEEYFAAAKTGNPAYAAYGMTRYCGSSREWAEGVIAAAQAGNPASAAYCMERDCGSSREWADKIK